MSDEHDESYPSWGADDFSSWAFDSGDSTMQRHASRDGTHHTLSSQDRESKEAFQPSAPRPSRWTEEFLQALRRSPEYVRRHHLSRHLAMRKRVVDDSDAAAVLDERINQLRALLNVSSSSESVGAFKNRVSELAKARNDFVLPILENKGWSILDWANEAGVDHHTAADYLKGKTSPYRSTRKKLAKALGIEPQKLPS